MEVLIVSHGGREGKGSLSQKRSIIWRKQLKQAYRKYGWNENKNKRTGASIEICQVQTGGGIQREMEENRQLSGESEVDRK